MAVARVAATASGLTSVAKHRHAVDASFASSAAEVTTYPVPLPTSTTTRGGACVRRASHSAASVSTSKKLSCGDAVARGASEERWVRGEGRGVGTVNPKDGDGDGGGRRDRGEGDARGAHLRGFVHLRVERRVLNARNGHGSRRVARRARQWDARGDEMTWERRRDRRLSSDASTTSSVRETASIARALATMASLTMSARCGSAPIVSPRRARHHLRPWRAAVPPLRRGATVLDTAAADADADAERAAVEADTRAWLDTVVMGLNLCPFARAALPGTSVLVTRASTLSELRVELARELAVLRDAPVETARTTLVVIPPSLLSALDAGTFEGFMDGAIAAAEDETRALTDALEPARREGLLDNLVDIVPFHPDATFGAIDAPEDERESGGYICTYLDVPEDDDGETSPPDEAALREMIAAHARFGSGADTRADWAEANAKTASDSGSAADDADDEESGDAPIDPADYTGRSPHPVIHLLRQCDIDAADEAWYEQGPGDDIRAKNAALLRGMGESRLRSMLRACVETSRR